MTELRNAAMGYAETEYRPPEFHCERELIIGGFLAGAAFERERAARVADVEAQDAQKWLRTYEREGDAYRMGQCQGGWDTATDIARAIRALGEEKKDG